MWIDHFLNSTQYTALNAKKLSKLSYADMAAIIAIKQKSLEASVRRKLQKQKKQEEKELVEEAETFKLFM
jgi:DNA-directed RNA polymerase specialized sigma24 family protein